MSATATVNRRPNRTFECEVCGLARSVYARPGRPLQRFCSPRCRNAWTVKHRAPSNRTGALHHAWTGDAVSEKGGRRRALRAYPPRPCEVCGAAKADRHHKDGNTANNEPSNIAFLCRRHHMEADGRMEAARAQMRAVQPLGIAARYRHD